MDNGDAEIARINKVTNQIDETPIPLTSHAENGFGLAVFSDWRTSPLQTTMARLRRGVHLRKTLTSHRGEMMVFPQGG